MPHTAPLSQEHVLYAAVDSAVPHLEGDLDPLSGVSSPSLTITTNRRIWDTLARDR